MVRLIKGENDLATLNPTLAKEWHPTGNGNLKPEDVTPGSGKEVWWLCPKGHHYLMVVNQRAKRLRMSILLWSSGAQRGK